MNEKYDFSGWATKNNLKCTDGRTIRHNAFKDNDGKKVPLVWNHNHTTPEEVLGHALLENRDEGVYCYGTFNDTSSGQVAKVLVQHGDITALSIYAGGLKQIASDVIHGDIKEVSLVHAGANPEAFIDTVIAHSDDSDEEAIIYMGNNISLQHSNESSAENENKDDKTLGDVFNTLTDEQKNAVYAFIGLALEGNEENNDNEKGEETMKHNVFETHNTFGDNNILKHSAITFDGKSEESEDMIHSAMDAIITDGKRYGSLKESFLAHADEYGIKNIDYLFPDAQTVTNTPGFITRDTGWAKKVMHSVHHTPFSRIKSVFANLTEDEARAKGYIKGKMKKEEVFSLLKRTTSPTTVYKKQKLDRDDAVDIIDFDVVAWMKSEMRMMLDEELARAYLVGDGRLASSDDKINESNIRPIWTDDELYSIKQAAEVKASATGEEKARAFIKAAIKARKNYKGSGKPVAWMTEDLLTDCLLLTDTTGRDLYDSVEKLATKLRVSEIVTVPVMEGLVRTDTTSNKKYELGGIIVNLNDYNVGADKGGSVNMFDDFDIDYNAQKYLIETRCSGALTTPYSAIVVEFEQATA